MVRRFAFLVVLFIILFYNVTIAQTLVKGKVLDNDSQPLAFTTVALLKLPDSTLFKGIYTNDEGIYEFEKVNKGNYLVKVQAIGLGKKNSMSFAISEEQKEFLVEDIRFEKSSQDLKEVEISVTKPLVEFKNGNTILNIDGTALAAGNSAFDVLKKAPGVTLDNNNNIVVQGKQGVKVMIDGRLQRLTPDQLANLLKSMGAESLDKIEIMKNPSSKYDAEGTSGIINIKTKKAKLIGFNGALRGGLNKGEMWGGNGGLSLNYKGEKFSVFGGVNANQRNSYFIRKLDRKVSTGTINEIVFSQNNTEVQTNTSENYKLGADWFVNDKTTLGFVYDGGTGKNLSDGKNITYISGNNTVGFDHLVSLSYNPNVFYNNNININGLHKLDSNNSQIDFSLDYTNYIDNAKNKYSNRFYDINDLEVNSMFPNIYNNNTVSNIDIYIGALNFTKKITKKLNLESGLKYSHVQTVNSLLFERKDTLSENFYNDTRFSNNFKYTEQVSAGYFNLQREIPHGSFQLGLRGEHTLAQGFNITSNSKINRNYFQLFPNLSLDWGKSEQHKFQLSYSRRINRPNYFQLNPFKYYLDQYTLSEGNPFLNPEKSNNASITYIFKQFLYNTISYQQTTDVMQQFTTQNDTTKETKQVTRNIAASNNYAYNVFAYLPIKKWWTAQVSLSAWYMDFEGSIDGKIYKKGKPSWQANVTNEIILPKNVTIELSGQYTSSLLFGIFQLQQQGSVDIGIKKSFWNKKATLLVGITDMFYTDRTRVAVQFENQNLKFMQLNDTRRGRITFTYNFGNTKLKLRETKTDSDEKNRLKK